MELTNIQEKKNSSRHLFFLVISVWVNKPFIIYGLMKKISEYLAFSLNIVHKINNNYGTYISMQL